MHETAPPVWKDRLMLLGLLVLCLATGAVGGAITRPALDPWYRELARPFFTPPDIAFPIVWNLLFVMMAIAAWRVWRVAGLAWDRETPHPLALFFVQLGLNLGWSVVFFGLQSPGWALVEIVFLLAAILATWQAFAAFDRVAGWLFVPYIVWVGYATLLNASIVYLN
ncbi:TspO/MBR family protein [Thiohalospira sp.]|uniref:TspO/MBR family protein n=1 Tax=Thiohalospira sp. TaxID=3080549 RepID=UPI00398095EA